MNAPIIMAKNIIKIALFTLPTTLFLGCDSGSKVQTASIDQIERININNNGNEAVFNEYLPYDTLESAYTSISADGRFVAFDYLDSNLVPNDTNEVSDIFLYDREKNSIKRISISNSDVQGDGHSYHPSISADGNFIAFQSHSKNLIDGDTNKKIDIFVYNRQNDTIERISIDNNGKQGNDGSYYPSMSGDGRFITFSSSSKNLVKGDYNNKVDVFVYDRQNKIIERISINNDGNESNEFSYNSVISTDGQFIAFRSKASNLVINDTNERWDIFVYDCQKKTIERVSVSNNGSEPESRSQYNGYYDHEHSYHISINADGRFIAFDYLDSNLVDGDTNGAADIFLYDRRQKTIERISVNSSGDGGFNDSIFPSISADGNFVAYSSYKGNLVKNDTNIKSDIFVYDRHNKTSKRISVDNNDIEGNKRSFTPSISENGNFIAFTSWADNLVSNDTNNQWDVFVYDTQKSNELSNEQQQEDSSNILSKSIIKRIVVPMRENNCYVSQDTIIETQEAYRQYITPLEGLKYPDTATFLEGLNNAKINFERKNLFLHPIILGSLPNILVADTPRMIADKVKVTIYVEDREFSYAAEDEFCLAYSIDKNITEINFELMRD